MDWVLIWNKHKANNSSTPATLGRIGNRIRLRTDKTKNVVIIGSPHNLDLSDNLEEEEEEEAAEEERDRSPKQSRRDREKGKKSKKAKIRKASPNLSKKKHLSEEELEIGEGRKNLESTAKERVASPKSSQQSRGRLRKKKEEKEERKIKRQELQCVKVREKIKNLEARLRAGCNNKRSQSLRLKLLEQFAKEREVCVK